VEVARKFLAQERCQQSQASAQPNNGDVSFKEFAERFLLHKKADKGIRRFKAIKVAIEKLSRDFFGDRALKDINEELVLAYRDRRRAEGLSEATISFEISYLNQLLGYAEHCGYATKPLKKKYLGLAKLAPRKVYMTKEEEAALWPELQLQSMKDLCNFILGCAMRPINIIGLKWNDILWNEAIAHVDILDHKGEKKDGRYILNDNLLEMLRRRESENGKSDYVFTRENGRQVSEKWIQEHWRIAKCRANEKLKVQGSSFQVRDELLFYNLKHTCLSRAAAAGLSVFQLMAISNHSDAKSLEHYVNPIALENEARRYLNGKI
jgi:integrase